MRPSENDTGASRGGAVGGDRWYVAQTQPRAESRAIAHLERQGYQVFCPRYRKTVRHTARDLWRAVNGTRGIARLISQGEAPAPLPHAKLKQPEKLPRTWTTKRGSSKPPLN